MLGVVTYTSAKCRASWPPFRFASDDDLGVQSVNLWGPLRTSYWRACATRGATTLSLEGEEDAAAASALIVAVLNHKVVITPLLKFGPILRVMLITDSLDKMRQTWFYRYHASVKRPYTVLW